MRTHYSSDVNETLDDQKVSVCGWVHRRRDLGELIFLSIRDRRKWTGASSCKPRAKRCFLKGE